MGFEHGLFDTGYRWTLMGLFSVAGVLNLWIATLSPLIGLEKLLPRATWLSSATGVILT